MHRRIEHIGIKTQQKFADTLVCARTDGINILVNTGLGPWIQSEVLIIDEYTAIFHRRTVRCERSIESIDRIAVFCNGNIQPPVPGMNTDLL